MLNIDKEKLRDAYKKSSTAEVVTLSLALRERFRSYTNLIATRRQLSRSGEKIVLSDYQTFWKDLEDAKVGQIIYGKRGAMKGFNWFYNLMEVAKLASGNVDDNPTALRLRASKPKKVHRPVVQTEKAPMTETHHHDSTTVFIPLRNDFDCILKLPSDLTAKEKESILSALNKAV